MKKIIFVPFLLLFLNGCLNLIQDVNLYPDGSGKMRIQYWLPMPDSVSIQTIENLSFFNKDSVRSQFTSPYTTIEDIEVYSDSTDSTMHAIVEFSFTHIDSLNKTKPFSDSRFSLKDGASGQKVFSQFISPIATGSGFNADSFKVTYKYTFSGELVAHNAQMVEDRTLIWNYTLNEIGSGKTISVTFIPYKIKETPYWIYALSGAVLLIVIFFLFRRKKD